MALREAAAAAPPLPPGSNRPSVAIQWGSKGGSKKPSDVDKPVKKAVPVIGKRPGLGLSGRSKKSAEPELAAQQQSGANVASHESAIGDTTKQEQQKQKTSRFGPPVVKEQDGNKGIK